MNNNPWIENTGTVPDGVTADTVIEVEYRFGGECTWDNMSSPNTNDPDLWPIDDHPLDVIRWRFV
jgi:hypothetical protein